MINLYRILNNQYIIYVLLITVLLFAIKTISADTQKKIIIVGNENTDEEIIFSIINDKITDYSINNLNDIIKTLYETGNFKNINTEYSENEIILIIEENPTIENIKFIGNKRFKKEEIFEIFNREKYFQTFNEYYIDDFISNLRDLYSSYGYNLIHIEYDSIENDDSNRFVDLIFNIDEGSISKINKIYFIGNTSFSDSQLRSNIKTKQRNLLRPLSNINYKEYQIKEDKRKLINFYKKSGFKDVNIDIQSEFIFKNNSLNLYFYIDEGVRHYFRNFEYNFDNLKIKSVNVDDIINNELKIITKIFDKNNYYNPEVIKNSKNRITDILNDYGEIFFELQVLERYEDNFIDIQVQLIDIEPKYVNQINIYGNTRTKEEVIRREIPLVEGDSFTEEKLRLAKINLQRLDFFKTVNITQKEINNLIDIEINLEEKSTGEFQVGVAIDSFQGATFITGLKEKNILGEGREINFSINTASENTTYSFGIVEPYITNRDVDFIYNISYTERDLADYASYKISEFNNNIGFRYALTDKINHSIILQYLLKDYTITDSSASDSITRLGGTNADLNLNNKIKYNQLDSYLRPSKGTSIDYLNIISAPTNNNNGYVKNIITYSKYYSYKGNVISLRSKIGNIFSMQSKEIPVDNKFALGGYWLRGFDRRGVGPRESRTSYIGGKNIVASKVDFQRPILKNSENPIDFNIFTDIGTVFDNQVDPKSSKESIRASYGLGFKLYSVIGPVGFSWAFPIIDEEYDIKRMFLFSIGNLN